jgi:hypothetical protein
MHCNYALNSPEPCTQPAKNIVVWGCLNQHIMEFLVCEHHLFYWINQTHENRIRCAYCDEPCAGFTTNQLTNLKKNAVLYI